MPRQDHYSRQADNRLETHFIITTFKTPKWLFIELDWYAPKFS